MKTIWLVYEKNNVVRNQFFIDQWVQAGKRQNAAIKLVLADQLQIGIKDGRPSLVHKDGLCLPDAAVMRLNHPLYSAQFESLGIPIFNNAHVAHICNDKRLTHQLISQLAPAMDTVFLRGDETASPLPYPVVIKDVFSCGGRAVYLAKDTQQFIDAVAKIPPGNALVQTLSDTPGKDVRAYVLGQDIIAVFMRHTDRDFRSNIGQGGDAAPYVLTPEDEEIVRGIIRLFDFGLVGIDFIFHKGRLVFNEIEDAVGTRMLFANGHDDIVARYLTFILNKI
ncbi:MAG: ATP-grasp domain-containing protein [Clostridiales bacterium]|nr:ATP-grasp domain-containing protein [Clostridiales bacterium]